MAHLTSKESVISFTFDDFPENATSAAEILQSHGARGTFYACFGLAESTIATGKLFSIDTAKRLHASGHEIGCHTLHHLPAGETPSSLYLASCEDNRKAIQATLGSAPILHSYPISNPRPGNKRGVSTTYACAREGGQCTNGAKVDLNSLHSVFIERLDDPVVEATRLIQNCIRQGSWLIFSTHDISDTPSRYGCKTETFRRIVSIALASGASIYPVGAALKKKLL